MAPSRNHHHLFLTFALTAIFLSSLTPFSGGMRWRDEEELRKKLVLGSRPPACVNKCLSCRPCEATLVIPPHHTTIKPNHLQPSSHREDGTYYLLSWKCRCNNVFHQISGYSADLLRCIILDVSFLLVFYLGWRKWG